MLDTETTYETASPVEWMSFVLAAVRAEGGFVTVKQAQLAGGVATADIATRAREEWLDHEAGLKNSQPAVAWWPTMEDHGQAIEIIEWARLHFDHAHRTDYQDMVFRVLNQVQVTVKQVRILASVYPQWVQNTAVQPDSAGYYGTEGQRIDLRLEVLERRFIESATYASYVITKTFLKLRDDQGHIFIWWASGARSEDVGHVYRVRGTVRRHDLYRGEEQTVLTNCRVYH